MLHYIPIISDMLKYIDSIPSDYNSLKQTLETNQSISLMLGGVKEMMNIEKNTIHLHIKKRKGAFRLSLETNKPIIPILTFGESELIQPYSDTYTQTINNWLHSRFGIMIPFLSWSSLYRWYQLSYKPLDKITSYVGNPIHPETNDSVESLRKKYMKEMKRMFREHAVPGQRLVIS